jgi:ribosomal protein L11 methyltransferase
MNLEKKTYGVDDAVRRKILSMIVTSTTKITPLALEKKLFEEFSFPKKQVKSVIRGLVAEGELAYSYDFGSSFLVRSFAKPVRVSKHFVLQPPEIQPSSGPDDVVVRIKPGAAFGAGNHPSTRLAINGIEFVLCGGRALDGRQSGVVLDIGTGSGVLLISAVLGGFKSGLGIDIDACARAEAAENVKINGLEDRVAISAQSLDDIHQRYSIILANLRFPSLKRLRFQIKEKTEAGCFLVVSGIRDHERVDLMGCYREIQFQKLWSANELGWSGMVLRKSG